MYVCMYVCMYVYAIIKLFLPFLCEQRLVDKKSETTHYYGD